MFCPKCARKNPDKNKFCNGCGTALRGETFLPVRPTPASAPPPPPIKQVPSHVARPIDEMVDYSKQAGREICEDVQRNKVFRNEITSIGGDKEISTKTEGDEDLSKFLEEAEARLDELFPDTIDATSTDSNLGVQKSERPTQISPTSAAAKPVSDVQDSPHYVQTQGRSGKTKLVIVTISALLILILLGAVVALRWSSNPPNTSATTSEPTKPTADKTSPGMAYIPGGEFIMGGDIQEFNGKKFTSPPHKVSVKPFLMDVYEVTCEAYKLFLDATGYGPPKGWKGKNYPLGAAKLPVTNVNWDAANAYAKWAGKRLPTETEWEFAARGSEGRLYSWGSEWNDGMANANNVKTGMVDVGTYKGASPFDIYDLIGNACEWTSTTLEPYPGGTMPVVDPKLEYKMIRGGTWESSTAAATATRRGFYGARDETSYENTSFRCVKDMTEK